MKVKSYLIAIVVQNMVSLLHNGSLKSVMHDFHQDENNIAWAAPEYLRQVVKLFIDDCADHEFVTGYDWIFWEGYIQLQYIRLLNLFLLDWHLFNWNHKPWACVWCSSFSRTPSNRGRMLLFFYHYKMPCIAFLGLTFKTSRRERPFEYYFKY